MYPMFRLVATGEDTPKNMDTLFGPNSSANLANIHRECRMSVLMRPPPSPGSAHTVPKGPMNEGCPYWTPREASKEEQDLWMGGMLGLGPL